jgi:hypothetical protein
VPYIFPGEAISLSPRLCQRTSTFVTFVLKCQQAESHSDKKKADMDAKAVPPPRR